MTTTPKWKSHKEFLAHPETKKDKQFFYGEQGGAEFSYRETATLELDGNCYQLFITHFRDLDSESYTEKWFMNKVLHRDGDKPAAIEIKTYFNEHSKDSASYKYYVLGILINAEVLAGSQVSEEQV